MSSPIAEASGYVDSMGFSIEAPAARALEHGQQQSNVADAPMQLQAQAGATGLGLAAPPNPSIPRYIISYQLPHY
jgi:hypothetical protein